MNNVSTQRMQAMLNLIGSSFAHNAMNRVDVTVRNGSAAVANASVKGDCGDGVRDFGTTDANGYLEVRVPHVTCDFTATTATGAGGVKAFAVSGDRILPITLYLGRRHRPGDALADPRHAGLVRRVHAGHHEDLRVRDDGQRDLDRR